MNVNMVIIAVNTPGPRQRPHANSSEPNIPIILLFLLTYILLPASCCCKNLLVKQQVHIEVITITPINIRSTITENTRYNVSSVHNGTHVPCSRLNINLPNP